MIQPFTITQDQLKDIEYICPTGKNYNLQNIVNDSEEQEKKEV